VSAKERQVPCFAYGFSAQLAGSLKGCRHMCRRGMKAIDQCPQPAGAADMQLVARDSPHHVWGMLLIALSGQ
jgi:hypothetical protein